MRREWGYSLSVGVRSASKGNARVGISWCLDKINEAVSVILFACVAPILIIACCGLYEDFEIGLVAEDDAPADISDDSEKFQFLAGHSDARAWLMIEDTAIDYPVMQSNDNSWYLSRNYKGEFSGAGSLFLDWRKRAGDDA